MNATATKQLEKSQSPNRKGWHFALALALIPIVLLVLLEVGLRYVNYGQQLALFIPATDGFDDHLMTNWAVSKRFFQEEDSPPAPHREQFLRRKTDNMYRIFMIGESTAAGWPYEANMMPSRILASRLTEAFPDKQIEVVNVAITAINSYAFLDFADEILAQSPDAILIYGGHNEFYGAMGVGSSKSVGNQRWLVNTYLALQHFKTFQWLKVAINAAQRSGDSSGKKKSKGTLMLQMVQDKNIPFGSHVREQGIDQFRGNMQDLLAKFKKAGVPVLISEQVSNLRDQPPFVSVAENGQPAAMQVYQQAQQLDKAGRYDEARAAYVLAKDLDALPFRAPELINQTIHALARQFEYPIVPMQSYFEKASPNGIIGSQLMMEHLHPTAQGYFLISEAFLDSMRQAGMVQANWPQSVLTAGYREAWGITEFDVVLARMRIAELTDSWPFKPLAVSGQTFASYEPKSKLEAMALGVVKGRVKPVSVHAELVAEDEKEGDIDGALREYAAMIEIEPFEVENHRKAAVLALTHQRLDDALPILLRAIRTKPIAQGSKWIAQIYIRRNDLSQAARYLELARAWDDENDGQIAFLRAEVERLMKEAQDGQSRGAGTLQN